MTHRYTDIFFDLDHTLWDFERNSALAFASVFDQHRIQLDLETFLRVYVPINHAYWKRYQLNEISGEELRYGRMRDALVALDHPAELGLLQQMSVSYIENLPGNNHLFEGAVDLLEYLTPRYRLHIITNGFSTVQVKKLEGSGIATYFKTVTDSEQAGARKPSAEIFRYALDRAGVHPEQSLMIGDSWEADVEGALAAGMDALHFDPQANKVQQQVRSIRYLNELKNML